MKNRIQLMILMAMISQFTFASQADQITIVDNKTSEHIDPLQTNVVSNPVMVPYQPRYYNESRKTKSCCEKFFCPDETDCCPFGYIVCCPCIFLVWLKGKLI